MERRGSGQNSANDSEPRIWGTVTDAPNTEGIWLAEAMPQVQQGLSSGARLGDCYDIAEIPLESVGADPCVRPDTCGNESWLDGGEGSST